MKNKLLLEITYTKLLYNTRKNFDSKRKSKASSVELTNTIFIPYIENDSLEIQSESRTKNDTYTSTIIFDNVIFKNDVGPLTATVIGTDGEEYAFNRISKNRADVKVNCSCLDFHYRFAAFNHRDGALAGNPPEPYVKKTDRPSVNPKKSSGLCKHLIRMIEELEKEDIFL